MREKQSASIPVSGPTPLDEIRQVEAASASQLFHAQQEAQALKQAAVKQAEQMEQQATKAGSQAGQAHYEQLVAEATGQAEQVVADAQTQAALLASQGQDRVQPAVDWAVHFVLGIEAKDWRP